MKSRWQHGLIALLLVSLPSVSSAQVQFNFSLNTSAFQTLIPANQPMYLYFALNNGGIGDASGDNKVLINNFKLGTGGTFGIGAGNQGGVNVFNNTLTNAVPNPADGFNLFDDSVNGLSAYYLQEWTPGTQLSFTVTTTLNIDPSNIPDQIQFAILYNNGPGGGYIDLSALDPTLPAGSDYLPFLTTGGISQFEFNIFPNNNTQGNPPNINGSVAGYTTLPADPNQPPGGSPTNNPFGPGIIPAAPFIVPEPSTYVVWGITGLLGGGYLYRRRKLQNLVAAAEMAQL